jgi:hypothetical protein
MSYESDIKKLQKLWENSQDNGFTLEVTQVNLYKQNQNIEQLPPRIININNLVDQGGELQDVKLLVAQLDGSVGSFKTTGMQWVITANNIPENWLSMVRFEVGYQFTGDDPTTNTQFSWFVTFEPSLTDSTIGKATWYVTFSALQTPDFKIKLYFVLLNPNLFV